MARLGSTDLDVHPLCLGGNVFGWTIGEEESFAVLDAYAAAGGNFVDTADVYSAWADGNAGGESETLIGRWMASRGNRDEIVLATKVGMLDGSETLDEPTIRAAAEASLARLQTDRIDLYYAHQDDPATPLPETLAAFDGLVREGKVRVLGASNYAADRLAEALAVSQREGLARYDVLQPKYNLVERGSYEGELAELCARHGIACVPYAALASGFLTGKYRPGEEADGIGESPRAGGARKYLDSGPGVAVLEALDTVAGAHGTSVTAVALAWLAAQPTVAAPIASARTPAQLADLLAFAGLELSAADLGRLTEASESRRGRATEASAA